MDAWGKALDVQNFEANNSEGRITLLGDPEGALTRKLDVEMTHPGPASVGIIGRCKRFALYAVNGEVKYVAISEAEDDPAGDDNPSRNTSQPSMQRAGHIAAPPLVIGAEEVPSPEATPTAPIMETANVHKERKSIAPFCYLAVRGILLLFCFWGLAWMVAALQTLLAS